MVLIQNLVLNNVQHLVEVTNIPLTNAVGLGKLHVHTITKGGAYNHFYLSAEQTDLRYAAGSVVAKQLKFGTFIDELVENCGLMCPTHLKIDVDENEPDIISGASATIRRQELKTILIELDSVDAEHRAVIEKLKIAGFILASRRSNWESRKNRIREEERFVANFIFQRPS